MATPLPPPAGPDEDRGPALIAIGWTLTATALLTQFGRLYCRLRIRQLGWDDYLMFFTTLLDVAFTIVLTILALNGGARHAYYLLMRNPSVVPYVTKLEWILQPFLIIALGTGKASVGVLLLRFLTSQQRWQRWAVWFSIVSVNIVLVLAAILTFVQCNPPEKLWNLQVKGTCWSPDRQNNYAMFAAAYGATIDIVLVIIPLTVFQTLKLNRRKKIGLSMLFSLGILAGAFAYYKTSTIPGIAAEGDFTWNSYSPTVWTAVETWLVIVSGTVPTLKPLWDQMQGNTTSLPGSYYARKSGYSPENSQYRKKVALQDMHARQRSGSGFDSAVTSASQDRFLASETGGEGIRVDETYVVDVMDGGHNRV
ncbi:hypothetical protein MMC30_008389 [Trapelia coarctata]|nr:hypothetical protein [Trapelia coarctata]